MTKKVPRGEEHLNCPLWREPMSEVCHKCPWWIEIRGNHPQTGQDASDWGCAIAWGPMLSLNIAQQARQTGAAVESFRNETVQGNQNLVQAVATVIQQDARARGALPTPPRQPLQPLLPHIEGAIHDSG